MPHAAPGGAAPDGSDDATSRRPDYPLPTACEVPAVEFMPMDTEPANAPDALVIGRTLVFIRREFLREIAYGANHSFP